MANPLDALRTLQATLNGKNPATKPLPDPTKVAVAPKQDGRTQTLDEVENSLPMRLGKGIDSAVQGIRSKFTPKK